MDSQEKITREYMSFKKFIRVCYDAYAKETENPDSLNVYQIRNKDFLRMAYEDLILKIITERKK